MSCSSSLTRVEISQQKYTSNPQRIRALAHPLRLRLLDLLGEEHEMTATQCAHITGQTVANCSFHLRTLAKYGYIERTNTEGREKPWRLVSDTLTVRPEPGDSESALAVEGAASVSVDAAVDRIRRWVAQFAVEPTEWVAASTITTSSFWATQQELAEVSRQLEEITGHLGGRDRDATLRPDGARPARLFASTAIDIERERR